MKRRVLAATVALLVTVAGRGAAAEPAPPDAAAAGNPVLRFRRVFAPAAEIKDWPLGDEPYLPMPADEFQRLVEAVHHDDQGAPRSAGALLRRGEYSAHLESADVLAGEALLSIEHRSQSPALLPLEPLGLAISQAAWTSDESSPAIIGRSSDGRVGVMVDRSGDLKLNWSLHGERGAAGDMTFALDLPLCTAGQLALDLPVALVPSVDRGLVRQRERSAATRRWIIDLNGSRRMLLRLVSSETAGSRKPLALVRQTTAYEFSPRGVDVTVQMRLDVHDVPLERLTLEIDPRLRLVGAHYGDRDIPWTASSGPADAGGPTKAVLEFPEPISGSGRIVRLSALAAIEEGQSWRLPAIRADATTWLEGIVQLVVPKPLVVQQLVPNGCRQSKVGQLGAPLAGESLEFQCFRPDSTIDLVVGRPRDELHVESTAAVEVSLVELKSTTVAQFSLRQNELFDLRAEVGPLWIIDSVEAAAPETIEDWQVDGEAAGPRPLAVHLKRGVGPQRTARLTIVGHRPAQTTQPLALADLQMLRFAASQPGDEWMALRASDAQELQLAGADELVRLDPPQFTAEQLQRFAEPPGGLVFAITPAADRLRVATVPRKPGYTGEISIDALVDANSLTETFTIRCQPQGSRLDRVLVFCSPARESPLRFSLAGGSSGQISAQRLPPEQHAALGVPRDGEVWEVALRLPRSGPFEIRGVRTVPLTGPLAGKIPLALASLPEASDARGTLTIRAIGETSVTIDNQRLKPIPAEQLQPDFYQTARGAFRYDPARDAARGDAGISLAVGHPNASETGAWVWQARLDSRYALRNTTIHSASFRVQTAGRLHVGFTLPADAQLRNVTIEDVPLAENIVDSFGQQFTIDLPPGKQFATVVLSYATAGQLPRLSGSLAPAWPEVDVPVLSRRWKLWLPAGYELTESDDRWESPPLDAPTWSQRLFGPLGRPQRGHLFDPFSGEAWREFAGRGTDRLAAGVSMEQFRSSLAGVLAASETRQVRLSWKELFNQLSAILAAADVATFADTAGLDQIGLSADGLVPRLAPSDDPVSVLLRQAKLFVLCGPRVVLLTSEPAVADYRGQFDPLGPKFFGRILPGPLAAALEADPTAAGSARAVPLAQWAGWTAGRRSPWRATRGSMSPAWENHGWTTYTLSSGGAIGPPVPVVRAAAMQSLAWAIFLAVLALAVSRLAARLSALVLLAAVCAAIALLVSPTFIPLAAAAFMAALCGLLYALVERQVMPREPLATRPSSQFATVVAMLLFLASLVAGSTGLLAFAGQPPAAGTAESADPPPPVTAAAGQEQQVVNEPEAAQPVAPRQAVPRVFVPVDEAQQPVGDKVYVPLEFYNALLRQAAAAGNQAGDWWLMRAAYHARLSPQGAQKNLGVSELKATFDLQVFHANVEVRLPLGDDRLAIVPDSAKLDGRSIEVHWSAEHRALVFVAEQAGVFRLELGLEPALRREDGLTGFEFSIPPLPGATLSVLTVGEPVPVEIGGVRGRVSNITAAGAAAHQAGAVADAIGDREIRADLGPTDRVDLHWPDETNLPVSLPNLDVEELIWVKLQPGSPIVDARFKFHIVDGRVRHVRILADPRLRLLPSWNAASPVMDMHILPGDPSTIDLELAGEVGEHATVDLTFLVSGTSGIGNFRLPRLEAVGARLTGRMLAVTLDPALHGEEQLGDEVRPLAPADFVGAWGESDMKPQLVYAIPRGEAAWSLATRPRETRSAVEQIVRFSLGAGTADVDLSAAINTTAGHNFQLRMTGPPGLEVGSVSIVDEGIEQVARWAKDDAGTITAFLVGPLAGRQQLVLRGKLRFPLTGEARLGGFQWPGAEVKKSQLLIYRQPQTLVRVELSAEVAATEPNLADRTRPEAVRLVGCYALENPSASVKLAIEPNLPEVQGEQITFVDRDHELWSALVDYRVQVKRGLVDLLRFDVPPQWTEPYQIEPAARFELVSVPGENRRQLLVYPAESIADEYRVRIRGRLVPSLGDRLRVPDILPRGVDRLERLVALASQWGNQQVDWETTGLAAIAPPADWHAPLAGTQPLQFYQVLGEHFQAALGGIDRPSQRPHIRLVDIHTAWYAGGTLAGVASFDLDPAGSSQAILNVPPQLELVHVSVAGLPVAAAPAGPDSWRIELGSTQLPQRIEAIYRGTLSGKADVMRSVQLPAPGIEGVEADRTLWTVYAPGPAGPAMLHEPANRLTAARQEVARMQATVSILDLAAPVAGEQAPEEILRWSGPWRGRFVAARNRIGKLLRLAGRPSAARDQELDGLNRQDVAIAERLGYPLGLPDEAHPAFDAPRLLDSLNASSQEPARCQFEGQAPTLTLRYTAPGGTSFFWRLLVAVAFGAAAFLLSSALYGATVSVAPRALIVLAGLFAWLCLSPSALGFVVMLVVLANAAVQRFRRHADRAAPTLAT